jgi:nitroreductase
LQQIYGREGFIQAPLVIIACALPNQAWVREDGKNLADVDVAIVMDHVILAATELGLGTCWIATINVQAAREMLGLPEDVEPVVMTPLGYPADQLRVKDRKPVEALVRFDHW